MLGKIFKFYIQENGSEMYSKFFYCESEDVFKRAYEIAEPLVKRASKDEEVVYFEMHLETLRLGYLGDFEFVEYYESGTGKSLWDYYEECQRRYGFRVVRDGELIYSCEYKDGTEAYIKGAFWLHKYLSNKPKGALDQLDCSVVFWKPVEGGIPEEFEFYSDEFSCIQFKEWYEWEFLGRECW